MLEEVRPVLPFWGQNEAYVDLNTRKSKSISGSNETIQIVVASIFFFLILKKFFEIDFLLSPEKTLEITILAVCLSP